MFFVSTLATVFDDNLLGGFAALRAEGLDLLDNVHALDDLAEHDVLAVQPLGLGGANEELRAIGVGSSVSHGQDSRSGVLQLEVLVLELVAVDGLSTGSVVVGEVSTLAHEVGDDTVEAGALVAEALLAGAQGAEVLGSLWHNIGSQLHNNSANFCAIAGHVKENTRMSRHIAGVKAERASLAK